MKKILLSAFLLLTSLTAFAASYSSPQPLPVDQAFMLSAKLFGNDTVLLHWQMAPQYYLYKDRFKFKVIKPTTASIGNIIYPIGKSKEDEIFGKYQVYLQNVTIPIPMINLDPSDTILEVKFQGCAENGYCYPPTTRQLKINFAQKTTTVYTPPSSNITNTQFSAQDQSFINLLNYHHWVTIVLVFLGFGLFLSFTPCVLPMLPILSGIIVGQKKLITTKKAFILSLIYVLSMAITYAIAGMLVGYMGGSVQAFFQKTWVLVLFSFLFVLMALSFFGLYQIKMPARFEERIANLSRYQKSGHYLGVAIMGSLGTLIVSPCVSPALVGVLGYISQTGNAILGGAALFAMGIGMGIPLLAIGAAGGKLLPKAGAWMKSVETVFGILFLGMAIWMLQRILPSPIILILWSVLLIICSIYLGAFSPTPSHGWGKLHKGVGVLFLIYGILMLVGAAQGNSNLLQPLKPSTEAQPVALNSTHLFTRVKNLNDVQQAILLAKKQNKPIVLDFYADWCVTCQEMERTTFRDAAVRTMLNDFVALQADVTANDENDRQLMQHFHVIAPPTLLFFNQEGILLNNFTLVGKVSAQQFLAYLKSVYDSLGRP